MQAYLHTQQVPTVAQAVLPSQSHQTLYLPVQRYVPTNDFPANSQVAASAGYNGRGAATKRDYTRLYHGVVRRPDATQQEIGVFNFPNRFCPCDADWLFSTFIW